jgi:hypothetical protein
LNIIDLLEINIIDLLEIGFGLLAAIGPVLRQTIYAA